MARPQWQRAAATSDAAAGFSGPRGDSLAAARRQFGRRSGSSVTLRDLRYRAGFVPAGETRYRLRIARRRGARARDREAAGLAQG